MVKDDLRKMSSYGFRASKGLPLPGAGKKTKRGRHKRRAKKKGPSEKSEGPIFYFRVKPLSCLRRIACSGIAFPTNSQNFFEWFISRR